MPRHISPEKARAIAYHWHGSASDPIYAFSSSGIVMHHGALLNACLLYTSDAADE